MAYNEDGTVAWEEMWDSFCELASSGGPPHRGTMLYAASEDDSTDPAYLQVADELIRGIRLVSGLEAKLAHPGWLAVKCTHAAQARWLSAEIVQENVASYSEGDFFFVPIASAFTLSGEIKNVITVVAKTTHYWQEHLHSEVKTLMAWEARVVGALRAWSRPK